MKQIKLKISDDLAAQLTKTNRALEEAANSEDQGLEEASAKFLQAAKRKISEHIKLEVEPKQEEN